MNELEKAATRIGKKLNADVVVVQKKRPFTFQSGISSLEPIRKKVRQTFLKIYKSVAKTQSSIMGWTKESPQKFGKMIQDVSKKYALKIFSQVILNNFF